MARRRRRQTIPTSSKLLKRGIRSFLAILVLTALVLGIAFSVKQISTFDTKKVVRIVSPFLTKIGIGEAVAGDVAGKFIERVTDLSIEGVMDLGGISTSTEPVGDSGGEVSSTEEVSEVPVAFSEENLKPLITIALLSDSHIANSPLSYEQNEEMLKDALSEAANYDVDMVIHLGDLTNLGILSDLKNAKSILDLSDLDYFALPGDRDLWESVGTGNFLKVFAKNYYVLDIEGIKISILDNSANFTEIGEEDFDEYLESIVDSSFVFLSQPLYTQGLNVPYVQKYMGSSSDVITDENLLAKQEVVLDQRNGLLDAIRASNARAVFAGDHHKSSVLTDSVDASLSHYVIGATTSVVNEFSQDALQTRRFSLLRIYSETNYEIVEIELN